MSKSDVEAIISDLEKRIHDLAQPLSGIRFTAELLTLRSETISREELAAKIAQISSAINESNAIFNALSSDLQELKKFL